MDPIQMNHIHLFGSAEENFYSLGRRDKIGHGQMYEQISKLCARSQYFAQILKTTTQMSGKLKQKKSISLHKELKAYADGLEKPVEDVYFMLLLPEIVASFNKWLPNLLGIIPGCSSLFVKDQANNSIIHGRVLDYALAGPFEQYERCISYEFKNRLKSFSYSTVGMPFPSLTTMNEKGLSLALHYKHGDYFDTNGDSIFSIMYQLISYCTNVQEVKKYLKSHPSISYWGIYASDALGQVASFDIKGAQIYQEIFDMDEHKYLYFNNRPLIHNPGASELQPFGNLDQCLMRKKVLKDKMTKFNYESKNLDLEVLKTLCSIKANKSDDAKNWRLGTLTPSSIQAVTFNNKTFESLTINGATPKIYDGQYTKFSKLFSKITQSQKTNKVKNDPHFIQGQKYLAMSQSFMDNGNVESAYHYLQMAIEYFAGYPEQTVAKFFFLVWQYIHENSQKDLGYLYHEFVKIEGTLPEYLNDHCLLFIHRLNKILSMGSDQLVLKKIKNKQLQNVYIKEEKMKAVAIKFLRRFTIARIEILDIIYIYA